MYFIHGTQGYKYPIFVHRSREHNNKYFTITITGLGNITGTQRQFELYSMIEKTRPLSIMVACHVLDPRHFFVKNKFF